MSTQVIRVPVIFRGTVEVVVPADVPAGTQDSLAEHFALSRVLATTDNPDAPDDDSCEDWILCLANECDISDNEANELWDNTTDKGVSGSWEIARKGDGDE